MLTIKVSVFYIWGAKTQQNSPGAWHYPPEGASHSINIPPGRGKQADRVQGGDEGRRSQGEDRREPEQEGPGGTQATAIMVAHGGAEGAGTGW